MPQAPLPENEARRLAAIAGDPALPGVGDEWSDELVRAAASLTGCPIALITILDEQRQWFRGCFGLNATGTPREQAFCGYTIQQTEPLVVEDAATDDRFADNPLVTGPPGIRFYAGVPLFDDAGIALGSLCVIDSKPRKISAEHLDGLEGLARLVTASIASNRRYRAILSASLDAIITINGESTVLEFNEPAERLFGYSRDEAIGAPLAELIIPPALREAHHAGMTRYLETGHGPVLGQRVEITAIRKGGAEFPVELTISPHTIRGERCFTAFVRDLTATADLNRQLRLTRFTVDQSRDAVMWVAPDASFIYVNDAACEMVGYSRDELLGMRVFDIEAALTEELWPEHWDDLRRRRAFVLQSEHRRRDGSTYPVEVACNYIEHEGGEFNCVVARDISERMEQRQELVHAARELENALERANEASEAKTAFLAHMSHELRTPLTGVLGFSKMLRNPNRDPSERDAVLDKIDRNGRALLDIINSILDLSKIETGAATLNESEVNLRSALASSTSAVAATALDKGVDFSVVAEPGVPVRFRSDKVRLKQILTNLLSNAVKYTDQGSVQLRVSASSGENPTLLLDVRDTGRGIAGEQQSRMFQAFERGEATIEIGGTGLGLAIVSRLVEMLGGSIELQSTPGEGSEFRVRLPLVDASAELLPEGDLDLDISEPATADAPITMLTGLRVMLVEDSYHVREVVHSFLRDRGARVQLCHDGAEAVAAIRDAGERPDVVLMDMQMPVMDGYEATRTLRAAGIDLPIVALTAHGMRHDRERCLAAGCDEYLSKPVDPDSLADMCARMATSTPTASPESDSAVVRHPSVDGLRKRFAVHLRGEADFLESADAFDDLEALRRRVHKMAGAAGNLGFTQVTDRARDCEKVISAGASGDSVKLAVGMLARTIREDLASMD